MVTGAHCITSAMQDIHGGEPVSNLHRIHVCVTVHLESLSVGECAKYCMFNALFHHLSSLGPSPPSLSPWASSVSSSGCGSRVIE